MEVMMVSYAPAAPASRKRLWAGRIAAALAVLFLIFDTVIKLMVITPVVDAFARLGVPAHLPVVIGVLELC
jgi:hypothetical protein